MTLYSISTYDLIRRLLLNTRSIEDLSNAQLLIKNKVNSYGELEFLIRSRDPFFDTPFFRNELFLAKKFLAKHFNENNVPPLYYFSNYDRFPDASSLLVETDEVTHSSVLPFNAPYNLGFGLEQRLKDYSIAEIKDLLAHYSLNGKLAFIAYTPFVGEKKTEKIIDLIHFYEMQILRNVELVDLSSFEGSLFTLDRERKRKVVMSNLTSMVNTLVDCDGEYIWGVSTDKQKEALLRMVISPIKKADFRVQSKMVDYFTDYATLQELESEETRNQVVKRFILK